MRAISLNPELRYCRVKDGSLLDSEYMALLRTYANRYDFQLWVERVSDEAGVGIFLEEGEVKERTIK